MAYITYSQVYAKIPQVKVVEALDDDSDGKADEGLFDAVIANAGNAVDGQLQGRYATPFPAPFPAVVVQAALIFTCEDIGKRREIFGEKNPWTAEADALRKQLTRIANREIPLDASEAQAFQPGAAITEESPLNTSVR